MPNHIKRLLNDADQINYYEYKFNNLGALNRTYQGSINKRYVRFSMGNYFSFGDRLLVKSNNFSSVVNRVFTKFKNTMGNLND